MRIARLVTFVAAVTTLTLVPAYAQGRGNHATGSSPHGASSHASSPKTSSSGSSTSTGGSGTSPTTTPPNPIAQKISTHPQLASKLTALLPKGMTLNDASTGFRNQGQFIAAVHVSRNLNIPFDQLKATMLGTSASGPTGSGTSGTSTTSPMSLGQAIHKLRPSADSDTEAAHATSQATSDLKTTTTSTTTSTSTHR